MKQLKKVISVILVIAALASMLTFGASAAGDIAYGAATVKADLLNIRAGMGTDYDIIGGVYDGEIVVILDKTSDDWYHINYEGTVGYVASRYLVDVLTAENFSAIGTCRGTYVRCRVRPSTDYEIVGYLENGGEYEVVGINNGWYKIKYDEDTLAYVRSDLMEITGSVGGTSASNSSNSSSSNGDSSNDYTYSAPDYNVSAGQQIVNCALQYEGYSYVYGGAAPWEGFDCSGLVVWVLQQCGYGTVFHGATTQYNTVGTWVAKEDLQPGDLVFFSSDDSGITHVGIYIGGSNHEFIHASTSTTGVIISSLDSSYYQWAYYSAKRVV